MRYKTITYIRSIQNILTAVALVFGIIVIILYKKQLINLNQTWFWIAVAVFITSLLEVVLSIITKESVGKGVIITYKQTPILYIISTLFTGVMCLFSIYLMTTHY